jgi:hypothetical protein
MLQELSHQIKTNLRLDVKNKFKGIKPDLFYFTRAICMVINFYYICIDSKEGAHCPLFLFNKKLFNAFRREN